MLFRSPGPAGWRGSRSSVAEAAHRRAQVGGHAGELVDGGAGRDTVVLAATSTDLNGLTDSQLKNIEAIDASSATAGWVR